MGKSQQLRVRVQGCKEFINALKEDPAKSYVLDRQSKSKDATDAAQVEAVFLLEAMSSVRKFVGWCLEFATPTDRLPTLILPSSLDHEERTDMSKCLVDEFGDHCSTHVDGSGKHKRLCVTLDPRQKQAAEVAEVTGRATFRTRSLRRQHSSRSRSAAPRQLSLNATAAAAVADSLLLSPGKTAPATTTKPATAAAFEPAATMAAMAPLAATGAVKASSVSALQTPPVEDVSRLDSAPVAAVTELQPAVVNMVTTATGGFAIAEDQASLAPALVPTATSAAAEATIATGGALPSVEGVPGAPINEADIIVNAGSTKAVAELAAAAAATASSAPTELATAAALPITVEGQLASTVTAMAVPAATEADALKADLDDAAAVVPLDIAGAVAGLQPALDADGSVQSSMTGTNVALDAVQSSITAATESMALASAAAGVLPSSLAEATGAPCSSVPSAAVTETTAAAAEPLESVLSAMVAPLEQNSPQPPMVLDATAAAVMAPLSSVSHAVETVQSSKTAAAMVMITASATAMSSASEIISTAAASDDVPVPLNINSAVAALDASVAAPQHVASFQVLTAAATGMVDSPPALSAIDDLQPSVDAVPTAGDAAAPAVLPDMAAGAAASAVLADTAAEIGASADDPQLAPTTASALPGFKNKAITDIAQFGAAASPLLTEDADGSTPDAAQLAAHASTGAAIVTPEGLPGPVIPADMAQPGSVAVTVEPAPPMSVGHDSSPARALPISMDAPALRQDSAFQSGAIAGAAQLAAGAMARAGDVAVNEGGTITAAQQKGALVGPATAFDGGAATTSASSVQVPVTKSAKRDVGSGFWRCCFAPPKAV